MLGFCALVALRRWRPVPVAVAAGVLIAIPYFAHDASTIYANATFISGWAAVFLYAYALGSDASLPLSLLGIAAMLVGVNLSDGGWNPVPEMLALGPYAAGLAVASRRRATAELEQRARELEEEREIFAIQSVRYERARIARELHDIVAHSVSLMVVQANAGERLATLDPESAAEALSSISEAARQAEVEIDRLVELLSDTSPTPPATGLRIVEELVARARTSGMAISCQLRGDIDDLTAGGADAAYRIVQEGITNALKHAPGASIEVTVRGADDGVEVRMVNGPRCLRPLGLGARRRWPRSGRNARTSDPVRRHIRRRPDAAWRVGAGGPLPPSHLRLARDLAPGCDAVNDPAVPGAATAPGQISVLIVDDQRLVRSGFAVILGTEPGITVVGEAADGEEAVTLARRLAPSVVLLDIRMPNMDGLTAARHILAETPSRVLILTTFDSDEYVYAALRAGASGFLLKDAPAEQLVGAVRSVAAGDALIDPSITRRLITQFVLAARPDTVDPPRLAALTPRERDVLRLVAQGLSNAEIATELVVEESTVKTHVGRILMKLDLRDRVQAVVLAYESGFVAPDTA